MELFNVDFISRYMYEYKPADETIASKHRYEGQLHNFEMHVAVGLFTILAITIYFECCVCVLNISILKLG